ncbi:hypothetical protein [Pedobacter agri]|uniref:hypothetical protein n=1 Tax=Pedobacter agri TaxID=454586 RepID=UPI00293164A9|nr:hypothetical protein [Pedobacter agri]
MKNEKGLIDLAKKTFAVITASMASLSGNQAEASLLPAHDLPHGMSIDHLDIAAKELKPKLTLTTERKIDKEYILLGSAQTFISKNMCSENYAYNRFKKCLEATGLLDKNYTLYSFKHLSNVRKFLAGWALAEICSANRHGRLSETETYLKELLKFVRSDKAIPAI